jgi:hypothetical protein
METVMSERWKIATLVGAVANTVRRPLRPRTNFEHYVPALMQLYKSNVDALYMSGFDPDAVLAELAAYQSSLLAQQIAWNAFKRQQSNTLQHASNVWSAMLLVYERAKAVARTNPEIRLAITEFVSFMKQWRRRKKPLASTPVTSSTPVAV